MDNDNNLKQIITDRGLKAKWISRHLGVHESEPVNGLQVGGDLVMTKLNN